MQNHTAADSGTNKSGQRKRVSKKLAPRYAGPFKVVEVRNNNVLVIRKPGGQKRRVVNYDKLKPYLHSDLRESLRVWADTVPAQQPDESAEVAAPAEVDEADFEVQEIVGHRRLNDGRMQYRLKWAGYDHPTWIDES